MSFWKRVGNLGKGLLKTATNDPSEMEKAALSRALEEELARHPAPTPQKSAHPTAPNVEKPEPVASDFTERPPIKRTL